MKKGDLIVNFQVHQKFIDNYLFVVKKPIVYPQTRRIPIKHFGEFYHIRTSFEISGYFEIHVSLYVEDTALTASKSQIKEYIHNYLIYHSL